MKPFDIVVSDLQSALVSLIQQIPRGRVATFGDLATALGDRTAARWVARFLSEPPEPVRGLVHRVVKATGEPGRYPADALPKLAREHLVDDSGLVNLERRFCDFRSDRPLLRLAEEQIRLGKLVRLTKLRKIPKTVAAVDVSYRSDGTGVAAYVLMQMGRDDPVATLTVETPICFPYVPGYLSYRELPIYAELIRAVVASDLAAPLLLVDGNGILHPRRSGIASQLGVLSDTITIGVTKHCLCGTKIPNAAFGPESGCVAIDGEPVAAMLPPSSRGRRPIYVSPGHRCQLADAVTVVNGWRRDFKLPEPIRRADALSRRVAQGGLEAPPPPPL